MGPGPPPGVDLERANASRIDDVILGGSHNFAVDREQAARTFASYPDIARAARANRRFLGRAEPRALLGPMTPLPSGLVDVDDRPEPAEPPAPVGVYGLVGRVAPGDA